MARPLLSCIPARLEDFCFSAAQGFFFLLRSASLTLRLAINAKIYFSLCHG